MINASVTIDTVDSGSQPLRRVTRADPVSSDDADNAGVVEDEDNDDEEDDDDRAVTEGCISGTNT